MLHPTLISLLESTAVCECVCVRESEFCVLQNNRGFEVLQYYSWPLKPDSSKADPATVNRKAKYLL